MRRLSWLIPFAVMLPAVLAAQPESPFPVAPIPTPAPVPPAPAGGVLTLNADAYYVVSWKSDASLRVHPAGLVTVVKETGPIRLRGKFAGGSGKVETKTFPGPCVYILEAVPDKAGRVELDLIPYGFKADADIYSAAVDVDGGTAPLPPPKPVPPKPEPPKPEPVTSFRVILIYESGQTLTAAQFGVLYGKPLEDWLTANCTDGKAGWVRRDKDADPLGDPPAIKAAWDATKPKVAATPSVAVIVNDVPTVLPLATPTAELIKTLGKYREGK